MRIAYLDCFAGISGDMFLGALLDAGVPLAVLDNAVQTLDLQALLRVETVDRSGISSTKVNVFEGDGLAEAQQPHTHGEAHHHGPVAHTHQHEHPHADAPVHQHPHAEDVSAHEHPHTHEHAHPEAQHTHEHPHSHEHPDTHEHAPGEPHAHPHVHGRSLTVIRELLQNSTLQAPVKDLAIRTFELLGHSEAKIHNVPVDKIHFHEVGAVDAIVDIVAASAGIAYLAQDDSLQWFCSPINVGGGMVECAHGTFPVPAPATADLLKGMPTYSAHVQKELVTPTGAALLRALSPAFGTQPPMRVQSIGYGAGTRNPHGFPNVLRLSIGQAPGVSSTDVATTGQERETRKEIQDANPTYAEAVMVLETALDDASPQLLAHVTERALELGALDVMLAPVIMKKGRPGTLLTVICDPDHGARFEQFLLRETTTLGVRMRREQRSCLDRQHATVETEYGVIRIKTGSLRGEEINFMPEFEDCRAAARAHGAPLKQVMQAAVAAYTRTPVPAQ